MPGCTVQPGAVSCLCPLRPQWNDEQAIAPSSESMPTLRTGRTTKQTTRARLDVAEALVNNAITCPCVYCPQARCQSVAVTRGPGRMQWCPPHPVSQMREVVMTLIVATSVVRPGDCALDDGGNDSDDADDDDDDEISGGGDDVNGNDGDCGDGEACHGET